MEEMKETFSITHNSSKHRSPS
uniref:Uncharacterized protein n=1 Tax=Arundo donax TaxID=35708 RepID=A0A0A8ZZT9_ARUDO